MTELKGMIYMIQGKENVSPQKHEICITGREKTVVSGVIEVINADSTVINLNTSMGRVIIKGAGLSMGKLDVSDGQMSFIGKVVSIEYKENKSMSATGISRLFK